MAPAASVAGGVQGRGLLPCTLSEPVQSAPLSDTAQVPQVCPQGLGGEAWVPATPPPIVATHLAPPLTAAGPLPPDQGGCVAGVAP